MSTQTERHKAKKVTQESLKVEAAKRDRKRSNRIVGTLILGAIGYSLVAHSINAVKGAFNPSEPPLEPVKEKVAHDAHVEYHRVESGYYLGLSKKSSDQCIYLKGVQKDHLGPYFNSVTVMKNTYKRELGRSCLYFISSFGNP